MRSGKGPEMRDWYFCWQAGLMRQFTSAAPPPHRHECVAFLPFGSHNLISLKPIDIFKTPECLADHLYQKRKKEGLLQREVAQVMNVALHSYTEWERGHCHPRSRDWPKVIGHLGFDPIKTDGSFRGRVEALMRSMGVSQTELAALIGVHRDTLGLWMAGSFHKSNYRSREAQQQLLQILERVPD